MKLLVETKGLVTGVIYEDHETPSFEDTMPPQEDTLTAHVEKPSAEVFHTLCSEFQ